MDQVDIHILIPKRRIDKPFLMVVEDAFPTKGHGTIVTWMALWLFICDLITEHLMIKNCVWHFL
jgi:hypothetical protein